MVLQKIPLSGLREFGGIMKPMKDEKLILTDAFALLVPCVMVY